jgi:hypothetical protein
MNLRILNCDGLHVSDLSPLKGMPLETLDLTGTKVEDLTALGGMKLEQLGLERSKVSDLSLLKGMKLTALSVRGTSVSDLSPLAGMRLTFLHCGGSYVSDLSPLNGMPLGDLNCAGTKVTDASLDQINKCHDLRLLVLNDTQASDLGLAHLKDHKNLRRIMLQGTRASDLSPLKDMPLEEIRLTPRNISKKGLDLLRHMKTLKTIGTDWNHGWPPAEFWARYEMGEFKKKRAAGRECACAAAATIQLHGAMSRRSRASIDSRAGQSGSAARPTVSEQRSRKWPTDHRGTIARTVGEETGIGPCHFGAFVVQGSKRTGQRADGIRPLSPELGARGAAPSPMTFSAPPIAKAVWASTTTLSRRFASTAVEDVAFSYELCRVARVGPTTPKQVSWLRSIRPKRAALPS